MPLEIHNWLSFSLLIVAISFQVIGNIDWAFFLAISWPYVSMFLIQVVTEADSQFLLTLCSLILEVFLVLSAFAYSSNQIYPYFS